MIANLKWLKFVSWYMVTIYGLSLMSCRSDTVSEADIITACQQTVFGYAHSRDAVNIDNNAALFTETATLIAKGNVLSGREEIKAGLAQRGPKQYTRHIITSVSIDVNVNKSIRGTSYALVYTAPPKTLKSETVKINPLTPQYILTYQDEFSFTGGICLIKNRHVIFDVVEK